MIINGGLYNNHNDELILSLTETPKNKSYNPIVEFEYSIVFGNVSYNTTNPTDYIEYLNELVNKLTDHEWEVKDNRYYTTYDSELVNKLRENDNESLHMLLNAICGYVGANKSMKEIINNYLVMPYIDNIEIVRFFGKSKDKVTDDRYNITVNLTNRDISIYSTIIRPNENVELFFHNEPIIIDSSLINQIAINNICYDKEKKYLDVDKLKKVLKKNVESIKNDITNVLYLISELIDKFYSSSLFDTRSRSYIRDENLDLTKKYEYYRFKKLIETNLFDIVGEVTTECMIYNNIKIRPDSEGFYNINIGPFTLQMKPGNKHDTKAKLITCAVSVDHDANKVNESIVYYNANDTLSNNKTPEIFQRNFYGALKAGFGEYFVYEEVYNDIDIFKEKQPLIEWFNKTYGNDEHKKCKSLTKYIMRFISRLIYKSIKYTSSHIASFECKNISNSHFDPKRCGGYIVKHIIQNVR